jgi:hypothetical protein
MPIYYVIGLAARICQQEGLASEKTIMSYDLDAKTIDMRRRIIWTVAAMEYGLAHSMGRPNNFATGDDRLDVQFFAAVEDENITEQGIQPGPPSERKLVAIHFYKMRMCQAEIRRALYEKKKDEPKNDSHPWFASVEKMNKDWLDASPTSPDWCKSWYELSMTLPLFMSNIISQVYWPISSDEDIYVQTLSTDSKAITSCRCYLL